MTEIVMLGSKSVIIERSDSSTRSIDFSVNSERSNDFSDDLFNFFVDLSELSSDLSKDLSDLSRDWLSRMPRRTFPLFVAATLFLEMGIQQYYNVSTPEI
jgi:hypothetical protein